MNVIIILFENFYKNCILVFYFYISLFTLLSKIILLNYNDLATTRFYLRGRIEMNKLGLNSSLTLDLFKVLKKLISFTSQKYVIGACFS